jgi:signal transduction histidine kinase
VFQKLYVRIWLAVVLTVAVLTFLLGWAWRITTEPPLREVVVRSAAGEVIGHGHAQRIRPPGALSGRRPNDTAPDAVPGTAPSAAPVPDIDERGPQFLVRLQDGQTIHLHLPRQPRVLQGLPLGFFWTLGLVAVAVALGTYPIVRRLTRRLEALQNGVQRWGEGDLSVRLPLEGNDEVGFLATRFNHAAQQIQTLVQSREALLASQKSLLANASHELRSPLTRIRMGLEMLGGTPSPQVKDEIARNIAELDQLIEEILLASRLDAQEADLGTVEAVDLVGLAAEECARTSATLDVASATVVVPGIAKLLRRAMRNLLENAKRHGAGEVTMGLQHHGSLVVIKVCDHGPGVPQALQNRVFEPFYRLPGASECEGGVGLGLALVKSIATRHGGSVACSNRPEGGACFEIRLPTQPPVSA